MNKLNNKPSVTIGIPAYNEEGNIKFLIQNLLDQKFVDFRLQKIIIVSDGSSDNTANILNDIQNQLVDTICNPKRQGKAAAQNQIIRLCDSNVLVILDADTLIKDKFFIEKLARPIISKNVDLTSARVQELPPANLVQKILNTSMKFKKQVFEEYISGNNIYTCHGRARAFSEKLYKTIIFKNDVGEDAYSFLFAKRHNFRYQFVKTTEIFYQLPKSFKDHQKQSIRFYKSKSMFNKDFGENFVKNEYSLPKKLLLKTFLKFSVANPILLLYFVSTAALKIKASFVSNQNSMLDSAPSTKKLNQEKTPKPLTICFFGAYDKTYTSNLIVESGLKENGVEIIEVNSNTKVTRMDRNGDIGWFKLVKRILKKYKLIGEIIKNMGNIKKSDAIYIGYPGHFEVIPAFIIGKLFRKKVFFFPVIVFYTGFVDDQGILNGNSWLGKLIKLGEKLIYKMVDVILPDTPLQKQHLIQLFNIPENKLKVLPIGADGKAYKFTPYANQEKKITATYYGLYTPLHGVEHIIEAARILQNEKDIKFTFVGNGKTFQENFDRAKKLNLKNVEFFHDTPESEHVAILQKADLFFGFLQNHETVKRVIPNKVYQGLALGKIVVTANSPVSRSVFTHKENIYLVEPSNAKDLAEKILELKNDPSLRQNIAQQGYELYCEKFTPKAVGRTLIKYIEETI